MTRNDPMKIAIQLGSETVWSETRTLEPGDRGRIEFSLPVKPLIEKVKEQMGRGVDFTSVPLHLRAVVEPQTGEADLTNNSQAFHISVVTKRSRLLIIDGRSRWETRYLHNMFDRDPAWQVDVVLPDYRESPAVLPRGTESNQWPTTKERLFEYDLIILGEVPAKLLPRDAVDWLRAFVETSGGGLIVIDGNRAALRDADYKKLQAMLPIEWTADDRVKPDPVSIHISSLGKGLAAFQLTPQDPAKNDEAWSQLPALHMTTAVSALPGAEVLATYTNSGNEVPLMVTRQFGAGRIFYSGTDETWRWRYKVADTYHQRFWNQIARWVMRLPMSVQGQFVSIDTGKLVYQPSETIVIRTRIKNSQGETASDLSVEAVLTATADSEGISKGQVIAVVPLNADPTLAGVYAGQIQAPASGDYRVSIVAPGLTSEALAVSSEFSVTEPDAGEMDQLSCDEPLLKKIAETTGGQYLSEDRADELIGLLRPLSRGKIKESDTLLWQSYWWFAPIIILLAIEWWIRKRVGLL